MGDIGRQLSSETGIRFTVATGLLITMVVLKVLELGL
jgi:hypothetical protein